MTKEKKIGIAVSGYDRKVVERKAYELVKTRILAMLKRMVKENYKGSDESGEVSLRMTIMMDY